MPALVHRNELSPAQITVVQSIPVTTLPRTFLDLAATVSPARVEEALDDALNRGLVSARQIRASLTGAGRGRPGVGLLRSLIEARDGGPVPESVFETRLLRALTAAGLPRPAIQHPVVDAGGAFVARLDFAYPGARVGIEADGHRWHARRLRFRRDRARWNALMLLGWRLIHVTWTDLSERPDGVVAAVEQALSESTQAGMRRRGMRDEPESV